MRDHFDFCGYCSPTSGEYFIGDVKYFYGEDFRSVKRYKEYKNVGFTTLLLQHENAYRGEEFETSACNLCLTKAEKAGIDKVIVSDERIKELCSLPVLIGEGGRFASEQELLDYLDFCTKPYRNKSNFYGLQLFDEPCIEQLKSYGKVSRGLRKIIPNVYLQCCLLPVTGKDYQAYKQNGDFDVYEQYLNVYVEESGDNGILFDEYPFLREYILGLYSLRTYQIGAKVCKERGVELRAVLQSFSHYSADHLIQRRVIEQDMYWQMNMALGFGCREYYYFTYFCKPVIRVVEDERLEKNTKIPIYKRGYPVGDAIDGATFINRDGSRTKLYYYTKRIISEFKQFESIILPYSFENSYLFFEEGKNAQDFWQTRSAFVNTDCPIDVKVSHSVALVTELKKDNGVMFMIENFPLK